MINGLRKLYFECAKNRCAKKIRGLEAEIGKMQETLLYDAGQGPWGSLGVVIMAGLHKSLEKYEDRYKTLLDKEIYYKRRCIS